MSIQGKTALVTGASRGIGRAIALEFAKQGAHRLILVARNRDRLQTVRAEIIATGLMHPEDVILLPLDLTQTISVTIAIAQTWQYHGPIHILVNCAGIAHQTPFLQSNLPQMQAEISTNLLGMYTITRLIAKRMAVHRQGEIVNVSSLMGKVAAPTMATYSATKFAVLGFTQALRSELAEYQVSVKALLPSLTDTDMVQDLHRFRWVKPMTPEQVAIALVVGMNQPSGEILVGWQGRLAVWANRLAPGFLERVVRMASPRRWLNSSL